MIRHDLNLAFQVASTSAGGFSAVPVDFPTILAALALGSGLCWWSRAMPRFYTAGDGAFARIQIQSEPLPVSEVP